MSNKTSSVAAVELKRWSILSSDQKDAVRGLSISREQIECAGTIAAAISLCDVGDETEIAGLAILAGPAVVKGKPGSNRGFRESRFDPYLFTAASASPG